ncbi:MAG: CDP-alcohol phosphatidyltransferase family protein [Lachnospirales bacterium]
MLDTKARKYIQPIFNKTADKFIKHNITATQVTFLALLLGILSVISLYLGEKVVAIILLWVSGYLDALDGTIARKSNCKSKLGCFLDIIFDRVVEILIIFVLCINNADLAMDCVFLLGSIIMSMCVFLTSGNLIEKDSKKSFYYQAGLAERTEGFIMLTLAMASNSSIFINLFTIIVLITAVQRFVEAVRYFK